MPGTIRLLRNNAQVRQRKERDVETGQQILQDVVIYTNDLKTKTKRMNKNLLFAIDTNTQEVIVSESPKGSNKINFIERIGRQDNDLLYQAVVTLTSITKAPDFDPAIFKAMDKVCHLIYNKHKGTN